MRPQASPGQRPGFAPPWDSSPGRAAQNQARVVSSIQGLTARSRQTPVVALGWLVCGPLALQSGVKLHKTRCAAGSTRAEAAGCAPLPMNLLRIACHPAGPNPANVIYGAGWRKPARWQAGGEADHFAARNFLLKSQIRFDRPINSSILCAHPISSLPLYETFIPPADLRLCGASCPGFTVGSLFPNRTLHPQPNQ